MNAFVDQLVEQHNAPRPKFAVRCVNTRETPCMPYPIGSAPLYRVYGNVPGMMDRGFNTDSYDEAVDAAEGMIFCGAAYATIDYVAGRLFVQELWADRPRSGALHYAPLPADVLRQLARLAQLIRTAPNAEELEWLQEQAAAVMAECDDCPPVAVRNAGDPPARRRQRHEERYGRRGFGPRNKSGRAKS